ncbi:MAG: carboxypeptidase-like regulatory domain-containing protein [Bacteroides sp.]|nr:carboxypeptidase-like regulatory domain-containing protein [Bacteroides sp.]
MKNRLTFLLLLLTTLGTMAQTPPVNVTFNLKGILVDSLTNEGEPYATIRIVKKEAPEDPVKLAVTDTKGRFDEKVNGQGDFIITISSIGKTTVRKEFTVTPQDTVLKSKFMFDYFC